MGGVGGTDLPALLAVRRLCVGWSGAAFERGLDLDGGSGKGRGMTKSEKLGTDRKKAGLLILLMLTAGIIYFRPSSDSSGDGSGASTAPAASKASLQFSLLNRQSVDADATLPGKPRSSAEGRAATREFRPSMKHNPKLVIDTERFDPTLRTEMLERLADVHASPAKRSLFDFYTPPAPPPEKLPEPVAPVVVTSTTAAALPPPRPPINLRFYGQEIADGGGVQRVFCELNDQVMVPSEGAVLEHRYKIRKISSASVLVEDLEFHNQQTLPILKAEKTEQAR